MAQWDCKRKPIDQELKRLAINPLRVVFGVIARVTNIRDEFAKLPPMQPILNGVSVGGRIELGYEGIIGGNNKIDQAEIKIDFKLINCRHNPNKSIFSFSKRRSGPVANGSSGE